MKNLRLGKDITIKWKVKPLENLTLFLIDSRANRIKLDYWIEGESLVSKYYGKDQKYFGTYSLELWLNYGKENQSIIDRKYAFKLVCNSDNESDSVELEDDYFSVGVQGESAFKSWLNTGHTGTEEDFINYITLTYDKLTDAQIEALQQPAKEMAIECRRDTDTAIAELNEAIEALEIKVEKGIKVYNEF